jgi:hypothetical protein
MAQILRLGMEYITPLGSAEYLDPLDSAEGQDTFLPH